jgi:hypothetical protein
MRALGGSMSLVFSSADTYREEASCQNILVAALLHRRSKVME